MKIQDKREDSKIPLPDESLENLCSECGASCELESQIIGHPAAFSVLVPRPSTEYGTMVHCLPGHEIGSVDIISALWRVCPEIYE